MPALPEKNENGDLIGVRRFFFDFFGVLAAHS